MNFTRCKNALHQYMYKDTATVSRMVASMDDEGADDYNPSVIYTGIPCKLSQYGKELQSGKTDRAFVLKTDLRICVDPTYDIQPNDVLVITHEGQSFTLNAARSFKYPTHQEISVRKDDDA